MISVLTILIEYITGRHGALKIEFTADSRYITRVLYVEPLYTANRDQYIGPVVCNQVCPTAHIDGRTEDH